jgi:TPR repeat protein
MRSAPSRWCSRLVVVVALAAVAVRAAPCAAADPADAPAPHAVDPDRLLLRGAYLQIPRGTDAHGKALWAYARYHLSPDKDMYDAAWEAHQKQDPLGTYLVMLCHDEGRAVRRDEKVLFELNFALRTELSKKKDPSPVELFILSQTHNADAKGVVDLTKVENPEEFRKREAERRQDWLVRSAEKGFAHARYELGKQYQRQRKHKEAFEQFDRAARMGSGAGWRSKAFFLIEGLGVEKDAEQGYAAALEGGKAGDVFAMINAAVYLERGWGIERDPKKAQAWIERAAAAGHWLGYLERAQGRLQGHFGYEKDAQAAARDIESALKTRNRDVLELLTRWYATGLGVKEDGAKAIRYGEAAFVQGSSDAAGVVAAIYKEGLAGVEKDEDLATYWGVQANPNFAFTLGEALEKKHPDLSKRIKNLDPWSVK